MATTMHEAFLARKAAKVEFDKASEALHSYTGNDMLETAELVAAYNTAGRRYSEAVDAENELLEALF